MKQKGGDIMNKAAASSAYSMLGLPTSLSLSLGSIKTDYIKAVPDLVCHLCLQFLPVPYAIAGTISVRICHDR
jgi:hypothetical protein